LNNSEVDELDPGLIRWLDVDGVRTRYVDSGEGDPLVLLHGGDIGSLYSLDSWSLNLPDLSRHFRVVAFDRIGQGYTDNPPDAPYRPEMMLQHTRRFFEVLGIRKAHVVGHSRGGLLAAWLSQHHSDLIQSLVLVNSRSTAPEDPRYPSDVFYERLGHRQRLLAGEVTVETVSAEPAAQSFNKSNLTPAFIDRMLDIARLPKTEEARTRVRQDRTESWLEPIYALRRDVLARIDDEGVSVPTLVVWGFNDLSAPLPVGLQLFERIAAKTPIAELHVLNEARHYCFRDRPGAFQSVIRSFCLRDRPRRVRRLS
jgi:2-hydroxy-6-oxo-6-(2'-carboxyphenyl)-hexa-2,4-dienoate hydrolase